MNEVNLGDIIDSYEAMSLRGGDINISLTTHSIKYKNDMISQGFDKQEILEKISDIKLSDNVKYFVNFPLSHR